MALHEDDPGFRFILLNATDGNAGQLDPSYPTVNEPLGQIRRRDMAAAWTGLPVPGQGSVMTTLPLPVSVRVCALTMSLTESSWSTRGV